MNRRDFLSAGLMAGAAVTINTTEIFARSQQPGRKFKLKYAPHFGMFSNHAGQDPIDELKFMADQGFTALEDNGMKGRPVELQEKIAREMQRLGIAMGVFVAAADFGCKCERGVRCGWSVFRRACRTTDPRGRRELASVYKTKRLSKSNSRTAPPRRRKIVPVCRRHLGIVHERPAE